MIKLLNKMLALATVATMTINASAQDLLANRAPSDRKLSDLKSIKFNNSSSFIDLNNPASDIYSTWDNKSAIIAPGTLPQNFRIDLRGFAMPTPSRKITSKYGPRGGRMHKGLDVKVYTGDTIYAAFDGKARVVKYNAGGWGYYVVLRHPNGLETLYGHLSKQLVKENQIVRAGQPIGLGGNTGRSSGSHLHFETRLLGQTINPALLFDFERQDVVGDFYTIKPGQIQNKPKAASTNAIAAQESQIVPFVNQHQAQNQQLAIAPASNMVFAPQQVATAKQAPITQSSTTSQNSVATQQKSDTYVVQTGDNLFRIATNHGLTLKQLCKLNNLKPNSLISQGQVLKVTQ